MLDVHTHTHTHTPTQTQRSSRTMHTPTTCFTALQKSCINASSAVVCTRLSRWQPNHAFTDSAAAAAAADVGAYARISSEQQQRRAAEQSRAGDGHHAKPVRGFSDVLCAPDLSSFGLRIIYALGVQFF